MSYALSPYQPARRGFTGITAAGSPGASGGRGRLPCAVACALLVAALSSGCSQHRDTTAETTKPGVTRRDNTITHAPCDVDGPGAEKTNVGGDSHPDMVVVRKGGRVVCRALDLNFDGVVDAWVYYDSQGRVSRRENDYDRDGKVDEIAIYQAGVLVEKQRATAMVGHIDTWHFYQAGKLARTERDSDGDSIIDQWWEYPKPDHPECPLIHSDLNGDGRPDPGASVAVCSEGAGYVPPERTSKEPRSVFDKEGEGLPTEVEERSVSPGPQDSKPAGDSKPAWDSKPAAPGKKP